ncbi:MAG TPA: site-2 protease family protein [Anaerolineaceae bacterium]
MSFLNRSPQQWIALAIILFISFPVHELAHALVATRFGDPTPGSSGRLTLNPVAHWDVLGTLLLVVTGAFGWAKPVPINPYALSRRSPAAVMWVSLAGPLSNFVLSILAAVPFRLGLLSFSSTSTTAGVWAVNILLSFILINLGLMLFNLIPIAPLDGEKIAEYFFPPSWARVMDNIRPYGPVILMAVLFIGPYFGLDLLGAVMNPALRSLLGLLTGLRV